MGEIGLVQGVRLASGVVVVWWGAGAVEKQAGGGKSGLSGVNDGVSGGKVSCWSTDTKKPACCRAGWTG